jgi:ferritin-like protein
MYTYFGMTSSEIKKNHFFDEHHKAVDTDATADNYYVYNGYVMDVYSEDAFAEIIAKQGEIIDVKCTGIIAYQDMDLAINNPMKFSQVLTLAGPDFGVKEGYKFLMDENTYSARIYLD